MPFTTGTQSQASSSSLLPFTAELVGITQTFSGNLPGRGTDTGWGGRSGQCRKGDAEGHVATDFQAGQPVEGTEDTEHQTSALLSLKTTSVNDQA